MRSQRIAEGPKGILMTVGAPHREDMVSFIGKWQVRGRLVPTGRVGCMADSGMLWLGLQTLLLDAGVILAGY